MEKSTTLKNTTMCNATLQSGIRKGEICNRACSIIGRCGYHKLKATDPTPSVIEQNSYVNEDQYRQYSKKIVFLQKQIRRFIIKTRYIDCHNDVSMFTQEDVIQINVPIRYMVNKVMIVEEFKGLYEWYTRQDGFTKPYKCLHTQVFLTKDQTNDIERIFTRILHNKQYMIATPISIKSIKTLNDQLYENCVELDNESYNLIFSDIFRCIGINMVLALVDEIEWQFKSLNMPVVLYSKKMITQIQTRVYTNDDIISLFENGELKLKNGSVFDISNLSIDARDNIISEIRMVYMKLYITCQLKKLCITHTGVDVIKLALIKDTHIWTFVSNKYLKFDSPVTGDNCVEQLLNHPSIRTYHDKMIIG